MLVLLALCAFGLGPAGAAAASDPGPSGPGSATTPLYVSDTGHDRVVRLTADDSGQRDVPVTGLNDPLGLALDASGALYIADAFHNRVVRVAPDGGGQSTVALTGLNTPTGLAVPPARTRLRTAPATAWQESHPQTLTVTGLSATLTTGRNTPVPGQPVVFSDVRRERTLCTAVTGRRGTARCGAVLHAPSAVLDRLTESLLRRGYLAGYAGTRLHAPASARGAVRADAGS
ncbi:hypothetical protein [Streptomyces sp. G-G2]|uniref:hypothetical protein n=1 Tax=Streptomyces sp. G-G2 TaxID=3046201 RepID=UPI0024B91407|nr:hypothetical protein [Streptomyces sp. G-G2]MDJ0385042.1 hypothetical protein [Streptomyces sp. G-G2]